MRITVGVAALVLAGCDSHITYGPGHGGTGTDTDTGGTTGTSNAPWSCDRRATAGTCEEYIGSGWDETSARADCGADDFNTGGCPASDIGGCDTTTGDPQGTLIWYYQGDFWDEASHDTLAFNCTAAYDVWYDPGGLGSTGT